MVPQADVLSQHAKQREELVKKIAKLAADVAIEVYKASKDGVNVNPQHLCH